jgi:hypothetical protein
MSIVTSFEICQESDCASLTFRDTTGAYSATNTTGYGSPNESIAGATAELVITMANGTQYTLDITADGFPTTDKDLELSIPQTDLGYSASESIEDQVIHILYRVTTALNTVITQDFKQALYCQVRCCVYSMALDVDIDCADCMNSMGDKVTTAWILYKGLEYSANAGDLVTYNATLPVLQRMCANSECSNCK